MTTPQRDIFVDFLDYVFNPDHVDKNEKYLAGRVMQGVAFGKDARITFQYCMGGWFAHGWLGDIKFRIYGLTRLVVCDLGGLSDIVTTYRYHICELDEGVIDETDNALCYIGQEYSHLMEEMKQHVADSTGYTGI